MPMLRGSNIEFNNRTNIRCITRNERTIQTNTSSRIIKETIHFLNRMFLVKELACRSYDAQVKVNRGSVWCKLRGSSELTAWKAVVACRWGCSPGELSHQTCRSCCCRLPARASFKKSNSQVRSVRSPVCPVQFVLFSYMLMGLSAASATAGSRWIL